ncbi:hypothetical protein [Arenimonas sp. MALMAid1274]|uniref:hypothetical protein n=1 Tax=Arenimonas sp. MALMAid1274 TaxID=3411630 RepID=UPI003BA30558
MRASLSLSLLLLLLSACGGEAPTPETVPSAAPGPAPAAAVDWSRCRFPGLSLPVPGRLFVVDGGAPGENAEPGRETIRRVDILVPGPVSLLLTAPDASVWLVRPSPQTRIGAIFASGDQPQRITGQALGPSRLERSQSAGDDCGRYWMAQGSGPELAQASEQVFGRRYDAVHTMRNGRVIIGDSAEAPVPRVDAAPAAPVRASPEPASESPVSEQAAPRPAAPLPASAAAAGNSEALVLDALKSGALRYAHQGDLKRWMERREEMGAEPLNPAVVARLRAMPSYIVVGSFTVGPAFSGPRAALFLVEPRGEAPPNLSDGSLVLTMALGGCDGTGCPPPPPPR